MAFKRIIIGVWQNHKNKTHHAWIKEMDNGHPDFGRSEYINSLHQFGLYESEKYTQAMGSVLFSRVWILSAANYFRLACKIKTKCSEGWKIKKVITKTGSPQSVAEDLELPDHVIAYAKNLHGMRNTIMHLVEGDPKTSPIHALEFEAAYIYAKATWVIYCGLLRNYGFNPDRGSWKIQTSKYSLPHSLVRRKE